MKKEKNLLGMIIMDLAVYAMQIAFAAGAILGVFYGVSFLVECLESYLTIEMGLLLIFTIAGAALYIDFRPEKKRSRRCKHGRQLHRATKMSSGKMLKPYSVN